MFSQLFFFFLCFQGLFIHRAFQLYAGFKADYQRRRRVLDQTFPSRIMLVASSAVGHLVVQLFQCKFKSYASVHLLRIECADSLEEMTSAYAVKHSSFTHLLWLSANQNAAGLRWRKRIRSGAFILNLVRFLATGFIPV